MALTVCTDERSRQYWAPPTRSVELDRLVVFTVLGVMFRFCFGPVVPPTIRKTVFFPAPGNPLYTMDCWDHLSVAMDGLFAM
jgi:hypothetical protein